MDTTATTSTSTTIEEQDNDDPTTKAQKKARQLILAAWRAEILDGTPDSAYRNGLLHQARQAAPEQVDLAERSNQVSIFGRIFNRQAEVQSLADELSRLQLLVQDPDIQPALPPPPGQEAVHAQNIDISSPRYVTYDMLCHAHVWVAPVEDNHQLARFYFEKSQKAVSPPGQQQQPPPIDFFISHSWSDDEVSLDRLGQLKNMEFQNQIHEHVRPMMNHLHGGAVKSYYNPMNLTFWLDKCCIPQFDETLKLECIQRLEYFVRHCKGMLVLMNDRYLKRLWCVYEWAGCLVHHHPRRIFCGFWNFQQENRQQDDTFFFPAKMISNLKRLSSLNALDCAKPSDWQQLLRKVDEHYVSVDSFLRFVRVTVIALVVRDLMFGIGKSSAKCHRLYIEPFLDLASSEDLQLVELRGTLESFSAYKVYRKLKGGDKRETHKQMVQSHFEQIVYPYLLQERQSCCAMPP